MRLFSLFVVAVTIAVAGAVIPAPAKSDPAPTYYLALGDSLSVGYQPGPGDTNQGYTDQLYTKLHLLDPNLQLVKLGCSGETTGTMINGGKCTDGRYPTGSQLNEAVAFLLAHPGQVKYLTLDIGANDVDGCLPGGQPDAACLASGLLSITTNLNTILSKLDDAGARKAAAAGMTYYDPFLQQWLNGPTGQAVALGTIALAAAVNLVESTLYSLYSFRIADVFTAYKTAQLLPFQTVAPYGSLPTNVANICTYTYMCSVQNIHPNPTGYGVIADTFYKRVILG